ncbi:putative apicomplexan with signal peptide and 3 transmembrane domain protein [Gregarina niphandrodes]|uniref:Apicomplexan with signal peptide and 3 transmembrane domain protein n=1 Tax=Gregarina niphandrodes TaxID=110365 RepID=A0A023B1E1_GRENI|nr:putative apicomplexan with signal peptide and 3 transmembrane domain protein [Gregarina niphandrodes]EZG47483.1 putative apicomplexan with signal peptide and 3 transmembrane domain protein [Gregarina niphandrodes]|eukprot:XP_011132169.1 putative apicomplexan with signal peptide and 3 transmembrane domain protein [Gregarina niphandrodes]
MISHFHYPGAVEQQEELLLHGGSPMAGGFTDRMEESGAKIEEVLSRFQLDCGHLFFAAGIASCFTGFMALLHSLWGLSITGTIESLFLLGFSVVIMLMDFPGIPKWAAPVRYAVRRQMKVITKVTGRGAGYVYLSGMAIVILWSSSSYRSSSVGLLFGLALSSVVLVVGLVGFFVGLRKSLILEKIRKQVSNHYKGNVTEVYRKYAISDAAHGLQFDEFNRLCGDYSNGQYMFHSGDLWLIYSALDDNSKGAINEREFNDWVSGMMTYL